MATFSFPSDSIETTEGPNGDVLVRVEHDPGFDATERVVILIPADERWRVALAIMTPIHRRNVTDLIDGLLRWER